MHAYALDCARYHNRASISPCLKTVFRKLPFYSETLNLLELRPEWTFRGNPHICISRSAHSLCLAISDNCVKWGLHNLNRTRNRHARWGYKLTPPRINESKCLRMQSARVSCSRPRGPMNTICDDTCCPEQACSASSIKGKSLWKLKTQLSSKDMQEGMQQPGNQHGQRGNKPRTSWARASP